MQFKSCTLFLALLVLGLVANTLCGKLNDHDLINRINTHPKALWKATTYPKFEGMRPEDLVRFTGAHFDRESIMLKARVSSRKNTTDIPINFDSKNKWPACIHPIRNQENCGGCWAFGSSEMLSDRFCIASNGAINVVLSPQYQISCDKKELGCRGGRIDYLMEFLCNVGTTVDSCMPYVSGSQCDPSTGKCFVPKCPTTCQDGTKLTFYRADNRSVALFDSNNLEAVQEDIMTNGPIIAGFIAYADLAQYHSGVYHHIQGRQIGGHLIKITGWGVDSKSGAPYWIIANSWGEDWGMNGFFWMLRGNNECGIEGVMVSAKPLIK